MQDTALEARLHVSLIRAAESAHALLTPKARSGPKDGHCDSQKSAGAARRQAALSALANQRRARAAHTAEQTRTAHRGTGSVGLQQSSARQQLHWVLLLLKHLVLDCPVSQVGCTSRQALEHTSVVMQRGCNGNHQPLAYGAMSASSLHLRFGSDPKSSLCRRL